MSTKKTLLVPFDAKGNMLFYPAFSWSRDEGKGTQREVPPFFAALTLDRIEATRAAATTFLRDLEGHTYPMILRYLELTIKRRGFDPVRGSAGYWTVKKHGANFSLAPCDWEGNILP